LSSAGKLLAKRTGLGTGVSSIACPSGTLCLMADHRTTGEVIQLLNNGRFGGSHALPANTFIQSVRCFGASPCYALGGSTTSSPEVANELFPVNPATGVPGSPVTPSGFDGIGMTCISATKCRIAGFITPAFTPSVLNVVSGQPGTPVSEPESSLGSIACATTSLCYTVGSDSSGGDRRQGLRGFAPARRGMLVPGSGDAYWPDRRVWQAARGSPL
jgi:hypothetical protein